MSPAEDTPPLVSIGMPVFNGEPYLEAAIDSLLAQTYENLELIISDNASTDRTEEICRAYAASDERVRYYRSAQNLGAGPNFNRTFHLSRGPYFKWAAHDDVHAPTHVERCALALEDAGEDAVQCQSLVARINETGEETGVYGIRLTGSDAEGAADRFGGVILNNILSTDVFGVIRRSALAQTRLHESYHRSDDALLAELALLGRFILVPEPLFMNRDHDERYGRAILHKPEEAQRFYDTSVSNRVTLPSWRLFFAYQRMISRLVPEPQERWQCRLHTLRWLGVNKNALRMGLDVVGAIDPRVVTTAHRMKQRVFGSGAVKPVQSSPERYASTSGHKLAGISGGLQTPRVRPLEGLG